MEKNMEMPTTRTIASQDILKMVDHKLDEYFQKHIERMGRLLQVNIKGSINTTPNCPAEWTKAVLEDSSNLNLMKWAFMLYATFENNKIMSPSKLSIEDELTMQFSLIYPKLFKYPPLFPIRNKWVEMNAYIKNKVQIFHKQIRRSLDDKLGKIVQKRMKSKNGGQGIALKPGQFYLVEDRVGRLPNHCHLVSQSDNLKMCINPLTNCYSNY